MALGSPNLWSATDREPSDSTDRAGRTQTFKAYERVPRGQPLPDCFFVIFRAVRCELARMCRAPPSLGRVSNARQQWGYRPGGVFKRRCALSLSECPEPGGTTSVSSNSRLTVFFVVRYH